MTVPVTVVTLNAPPNDDSAQWDRITECSLEVRSGQIVIAGSSDFFENAARIKIAAGWYRARIFYGGRDTLSEDGLIGNDHYKVVLWPAAEAKLQVLK